MTTICYINPNTGETFFAQPDGVSTFITITLPASAPLGSPLVEAVLRAVRESQPPVNPSTMQPMYTNPFIKVQLDA